MDKLKLLASKCNASVQLTYRDLSDVYEKLEDRNDDYYADDTFLNEEDRAKCIETDQYWTLHFYPDTPVGFYHAHASDPDMLLDMALEIMSKQNPMNTE